MISKIITYFIALFKWFRKLFNKNKDTSKEIGKSQRKKENRKRSKLETKKIKQQIDKTFDEYCDELAKTPMKIIEPQNNKSDHKAFNKVKIHDLKYKIVINDEYIKTSTQPNTTRVDQSNVKILNNGKGQIVVLKTNDNDISVTSEHVIKDQPTGWVNINQYVVLDQVVNKNMILKLANDVNDMILTTDNNNNQVVISLGAYHTIKLPDEKHNMIDACIIFGMIRPEYIQLSGSLVIADNKKYIIDSCFQTESGKSIIIAHAIMPHKLTINFASSNSSVIHKQLSEKVDSSSKNEIKTYKSMNLFNLSSAPSEYVKYLLIKEFGTEKNIYNIKPIIPENSQFTKIKYTPIARGNCLIVVDADDEFKQLKIQTLSAGMRYRPRVYHIPHDLEQSGASEATIMVCCDQHCDSNTYRMMGWQPVDELINVLKNVTIIYKKPNRMYASGEAGIRSFARHQKCNIIIERAEVPVKKTWITLGDRKVNKINFLKPVSYAIDCKYKDVKWLYRAGCTDIVKGLAGYVNVNDLVGNEEDEPPMIDYIIKKIRQLISWIRDKIHRLIYSNYKPVN